MIKFKHIIDLNWQFRNYTPEIIIEFLKIAKQKAIDEKFIICENNKFYTSNPYKMLVYPKWYMTYWIYRGAYKTGLVKRASIINILGILLEIDSNNKVGLKIKSMLEDADSNNYSV